MIPEKIGPYRIERKIGSGGMGTVYLGRHVETNKEAAVKILPASLAHEDGFVLRFSREIEAMRKLSSPYVVEVYESGVDDDEVYYYAMEYVEGITLSKWIRENGRMPWKEAIEYSVQICSALKAAHDAGIVHRDLKPSNLLMTKDHQIKLLDFGVAQVFASSKLTKTGGIIGTAEYMSSEQAQGKRTTKKSDIYSLGAVMYAMLTGRPPYSGKTSMEVIQKHKFGQFDSPRSYVPDIPYWLDEVVCKCLEKDPDKRFPDAYVLSLRLKEIIRKVELSQQDATSASGTLDGTAQTIVAGDDHHEIGGTFMRDMVRTEIERSHEKHMLSQILDNTWILVALLVLIIAGGFWWFSSQDLTPGRQYDHGMALYNKGKLYWSQARNEYLLPLLQSDPEAWAERVEPILMEIEVEELEKDFGLTKIGKRRVQNMSDAHRFLHLARSHYQMGDTIASEKILLDLSSLLEGQKEYETIHTAIQGILTKLKSANSSSKNGKAGGLSLAKRSLDQAKKYLNEKKKEQAISILLSLVSLYDGDSLAEQEVEDAKNILNSLTRYILPINERDHDEQHHRFE